MKKGIRVALVTAMFAAVMSGCGKKEKDVADDFKDVQGNTEALSTEASNTETAGETDVQLLGEYDEIEYEDVNLPVDATINYGDGKTANLHFDLLDWPSNIGGPISAQKKKVDENYVQNLVNNIFDDGQYTITTQGSTPGQLLTESSFEQGTMKESYVSCDLAGKVDGKDMVFYYSEQLDEASTFSRSFYLYPEEDNMAMGWSEMSEEDMNEYGANIVNKNEALQTAQNYLSKWGFDGYECVSCTDIGECSTDSMKPDGYMCVFTKKINSVCGMAYQEKCFYNPNNPYPAFYEQISIAINSNGLLDVIIEDMYEVGTEVSEATLMDKDKALEKGTKAIEAYVDKNADENYLIWEYEHKSVWNIHVDLAYIPIGTEEGVNYRAAYIFSVDEFGYSTKTPLVAIDACDGTVYDVDYSFYIEGESGAKG